MRPTMSRSRKRRENTFKRRANAAQTLAFVRARAYDRHMSVHSRIDFRILGPLEVVREAHALPLGTPKQRALLGFLLLHANESVSRDRLVDELWGEAAPATVNAALSGYLTKLRRALANGDDESVLATRAPGYVLQVEPDSLDAVVFERLIEEGRAALARGEAVEAATRLRDALSLWRGPALADLAYEPFAQQAIRRLEELRVEALEERVEADLVLGRHDRLVPELEALVGEHPYRERLRAQLILALYRCGRQADALAAYQAARRTLVDELGLEPGRRLQELEQAILHQDPALEAPVRAPQAPAQEDPPPRRPRWKRPLILVAAALALTVAVTAAAAVSLRDASTGQPKPIPLTGDSVVAIDPRTDVVIGETPVGEPPVAIAVAEGSVWAAIPDHTLVRIDARTRRVRRRIDLGAKPLDVAAGNGAVWVLTLDADAVIRVDARTDAVVARIPLGGTRFPGSGQILVGGGTVWVVQGSSVSRVEPATNTATVVHRPGVWMTAYGEDSLWVKTGPSGNEVERVVPSTNATLSRFGTGALGRGTCCDGGFSFGAGAVWTRPARDHRIFKLNSDDGHLIGSVNLGRTVNGVAFGEGAMWILGEDNTVLRVDPRSERLTKTLQLDVPIASAQLHRLIAAGEGAVWVAVGRRF